MSNVFSYAPALRPGRSVFNLSNEHKFDCDMAELVPILATECIPGDKFKIGNEIVIRFQPLVAPVLQEINAYVHYFFVPNRLVMDDWEEFITGGEDGESAAVLPRWTGDSGYNSKYSLWDYFGLPVNVSPALAPISLPKRAYNLIWNTYYRDENLQEEVDLDQNSVLWRAWKKDYFTSALPWQQRGTAPALPISGIMPLEQIGDSNVFGYTDLSNFGVTFKESLTASQYFLKFGSGGAAQFNTSTTASNNAARLADRTNGSTNASTYGTDPANFGVNLSEAATFDVADLRLAFQIQKWLERNAVGGIRYTEFLRSHFGVAPRDERLQRPEYIGGSKSPVMISEVLQTSQTTDGSSGSPQGNLAGHGLTADKNYVASYSAKEYGWIIGILSIMPKSNYQQGVDRSWLRETRYDYYFPEFAHLSEQGVLNEELYADGSADDKLLFGYQGRYNELRTAKSLVCGGLRDTFDYWHLGRKFASRPNLNGEFITCDPAQTKRIFAVQDEKGLIVNFGNIIKAIRPIPAIATPGFADHF